MKLDLSKIIPKEILTKSGNKTYPLNIVYTGDKVLVGNRKDKWHNLHHPAYITIPEGKLCLWYSWPAGRNQNQDKNTGSRFNHLLVPHYLPSDKLTMNALGLLQAEMGKGSKRKSNISFSNSEPKLINIVLEFFKRFNINENDWSWGITFNFKLKEHEIQNETKQREKLAEKFWLKNTIVSPEKRRNKFIYYTGNRKYKNMRKGTMQFGSLTITFSNIILFQVILNLLDEIKKILIPEPVRHYLQGIFAGEASVKPSKFKSIREINVGVSEIDEKIFYSNCLLILGIPSSFDKGSICVHNIKNFLKIHSHNLLSLHPIRHKKFLECMSNFKQIPKKLKVEYASFKKEAYDDRIHQVV